MQLDLTPEQISRDPAIFSAVFLKILDKKNRLIPFNWNRAQYDFHSKRTGRDIILKARQLGFSTLIQGEMYRRTVTSSRSTITLAHDADTTTKLRLMTDRFWDHCKYDGIQPARKYANASLTTYPELDSTCTIATAGTVETGRGGTYSDFHGSEVAFWRDAKNILAGAMQGGDPDIVLESTPNGAQGFFYEECMKALRNEGPWRLHFYPWWWDDNYRIELDEGEQIEYTEEEQALVYKQHLAPSQIKWRRAKQAELTYLFNQEYPEDPVTCFLTSGQGYFGDLSSVFTAPMHVEYNPLHKYGAGLDFGQTSDYTAMPVYDFTAKQQVDLLHVHGKEWADIRRDIKSTYKKWHLDKLLAEKNSIGGPNIEALRKMGLNMFAFETTNESKAGIMADLNEAVHFGGWKLQDHPVQKAEFNTFVAYQLPTTGAWRLAASGEGHDDTVIGNGLALHSGLYTVSDEELIKYGKGEVNEEDYDEDMIAYHADTYGMTMEEAMRDIQEQHNAGRNR